MVSVVVGLVFRGMGGMGGIGGQTTIIVGWSRMNDTGQG